MPEKSQTLSRLEKILHRFGDGLEEANVAFATFRRLMAAEGIRAPDLRLDLDGENRSSADALLRAFDKINTPSKQQVRDLEARVAELEKDNSKLRAEQKVSADELHELKAIKRNYDRIKARRTGKPARPQRQSKKLGARAGRRVNRAQSLTAGSRSQLELAVRAATERGVT